MIVFIDVELKETKIYGENGLQKIPFNDIDILSDILGHQKVKYVTNIIEAEPDKIINLIKNISTESQIVNTKQKDISNKNSYLHSTSKGLLIIPDMDDIPSPGEKGHIRKALVRFEGLGDCKLFDKEMKENIKKSPMLRKLIKTGSIEIIGEQKRNTFLKILQQDKQHLLKTQSARDKSLDNIIMNDKVSDWNGDIINKDKEDIVEIDVGRRSFKKDESSGAATMSELQSMIDGAK
ncbi:MAG: hypothetical protein KAH05_06990 [Clostridiales bacterium]|nr:hypothetical protein [Clostridiales bacterium]